MKKNFKQLVALIFSFSLIVSIYYVIISFDKNATKVVVSNVNDVINLDNIEDDLLINKVQQLQEYYSNTDIKGVISIDGINDFSYPVTQSSDNDYYLDHNYYKQYDTYGSIYADYRVDLNNSKKVLIFGHSSVKRDVPFNSLANYESKDYYEKYKYITLETETNTYRYEIFSVYVETNDFTYMNMNFDGETDWYSHILELQNKSLYSTDVELKTDDDILILQTCSKNPKYQKYSKKYLLVVSRRVK